MHPSSQPSIKPSSKPSSVPSIQPSSAPSIAPSSSTPSSAPSVDLTRIAPDLVVHISHVFNASIVLNISLSHKGSVTCTALAGTVYPASVAAIEAVGTTGYISKTGFASVSILGLAPSTSYAVYCVSRSYSGHTMSYNKTLQTRKTVKTSCCKSVTVALRSKYVTANKLQLNVFQLTLNYL
jgi:hypothetical protein